MANSLLRGVHHLAVRVPNFEEVVAFYTEGLGCAIVRTWGEGDGRAIMLDLGNGSCMEIFAGGSAEPKPEGAIIHYALRVDDCDAALQRALDAGAVLTVEVQSLVVPAQPSPMDVRIAFVKGLAGEVIEFFQENN